MLHPQNSVRPLADIGYRKGIHSLGGNQAPQTILNMRLMFSFVPAGLLLFALIALWRYPLTREYMEEVKAKLIANRAARAQAEAAENEAQATA